MRNKRYLFIGVRTDVLFYMLEQLENVIAIIPQDKKIEHSKLTRYSLGTKAELIHLINTLDFDILVSNGCPYILPVSKIKKANQIFINLHPSILPNFRGLHPINAAIYYRKKTGATCHIMDDSVDGGPIISQVYVDNNSTVKLPLLYQLCFMAEIQAFKDALDANFIPLKKQPKAKDSFFQRTDINRIISLDELEINELIRKIEALSIDNQYASIMIEDCTYFVKSVSIVKNSFLNKKFIHLTNNTVVLKYNCFLLVKKNELFLQIEII